MHPTGTVFLYNKTRQSIVYTFPLVGQTAEPNGLIFLRKPMGAQVVLKAKKKFGFFFFKNAIFLFKIRFKKILRATSGPSASM